jgi:hypothetical protein
LVELHSVFVFHLAARRDVDRESDDARDFSFGIEYGVDDEVDPRERSVFLSVDDDAFP